MAAPASNLQHLNKAAIETLSLSDAERIIKIRGERWIGYTRAKEILNNMDELFNYPTTHRMPNLLIVGRTNSGKTMIANRFANRHPAVDNANGDYVSVPVLMIQAPPGPDENRFYNSILDKLFAPYKPNEHVSKKQSQVLTLLSRANLKMLIIDEIQHILAGHMEKQRQFLNVIKYLGNELKVPIVGVGTKESIRAIQNDPQLANRFKPAPLPRWKMNDEYLKLLLSFERMLPLKRASNLIETTMASKLLSMSEGSIGELANILREAAVTAVLSKREMIDEKTLEQLNWELPSRRLSLVESQI